MQITWGVSQDTISAVFALFLFPPLSFFSKWEHKKTAAALSPQTYNSHNYWQIDWVTIAIFLLQYILYIYFCNSRSPWRHKQSFFFSRFHNGVFPWCWDISNYINPNEETQKNTNLFYWIALLMSSRKCSILRHLLNVIISVSYT